MDNILHRCLNKYCAIFATYWNRHFCNTAVMLVASSAANPEKLSGAAIKYLSVSHLDLDFDVEE